MKSFKTFVLLVLIFTAFNVNAQTDKATTAKIVEEKNFLFIATSAIPLNSSDINSVFNQMAGPPTAGTINLTSSNYDLRITPDSIVAYLPFYGRAFTASYGNNTENGYKFTSKKFSYETKKGKKRGWNITIQTKDVKDNLRMALSISESGYASLSVVSVNKQSITYNGYLSEIKKEVASK